MDKVIYLKLDTDKGIITIPFSGLEEVDCFTVMYDNMGQLVSSLIKLLNLPLDLYDVIEVYLTNDKYNRGRNDFCLPVKYSKDNFNFKSLNNALFNYIKNDPRRIFNTDMRFMNVDGVVKYFDTGVFDDYELEKIVREFLKDGTGYKRKRKIYFLISDTIDKEKDSNVKVVIDKVKYVESYERDRDNLSMYSTGEDNYLNNLIELSKRNPELFDKVMDEIAQSDIMDIRKSLSNENYGIIDGVSKSSIPFKLQKDILEETTGMLLDDLRMHHTGFGRKRRRK